ncbi:MAG: hypothetical protein HOP29_00385, partial [Phycisphaerales bacterium]|nr:hypothetical protein [Phycisphaerales bacterium]
MKNGTHYAKCVKRAFAELKKRHGAVSHPEPSDPIQQMIVGVLSQDAPPGKVAAAVKALNETMVDFNEIRVSTTPELARVIRPYIGDGDGRADEIRRSLNAVYLKKHGLTLEFLRKLGRREARQWLEKLDGVSADTAASVILWSLGGHAIPVGRRLYEALRQAELVEPTATMEEVRAFLERNVPASDAKEFCLMMDRLPSRTGTGEGAEGEGMKARRHEGAEGEGTKRQREKAKRRNVESSKG